MSKVISFRDVGAAKSAPVTAEAVPAEAHTEAPAQPAAVTPVTPVPQVQSTAVVPAASTSLAAPAAGDDEGAFDSGDIKLPKLKLLQGTSDKKLLQKFGFGALLFKDQLLIARAFIAGDTPETTQQPMSGRLVFVKLLGKTYVEKPAKFGDPTMFARSLAEVEEQGGTTDWRLSKENKKTGKPASDKPWYQVVANCLVLVEKPDHVTGDDADHFPFEADGKFYAPAMFSVKSFAYDEFFATVATARATGELRRGGYPSRFILLQPEIRPGKGNAEFAVPAIKFGEQTSDAVRAIAAELT